MRTRRGGLIFGMILQILLFFPDIRPAGADSGPMDLAATIEEALAANLTLKQAEAEVKAAGAVEKSRVTEFLPTLNARYGYIRRDQPTTQSLIGTGAQSPELDVIINPQDEYNFVTSFSQPIFTGFALLNQYKIANLGLNAAEIRERLTRQNVILDAKNAYFSVLKTQKLLDVAEITVKQIKSQLEVAENMYQVGMSPFNDLLQSQVRLANARQALTIAQNNLAIARSQFNTLLIRPVNAPVSIADILDYQPFEYDIDYCLQQAEANRLEIEVADLEVQISQKDYELSKRNYYPTVNLEGSYYKRGTDWDVDGGEGISDKEYWDIRATATWNFWQWGRTTYGVREKLERISQARHRQEQVWVDIQQEVQEAYLRTREAEQNIVTIEKAIVQAKENLRITEERYKEQVSTITDVLVAQTLFTETMTNYYNALYDYKIAKAVLYRAIGQEKLE